jgi:DNA-binding response OmpR family regulator
MARILLVDDELSIIDFVSYNLQKLGHSVEAARDGSEALSKLQSTNPDLLILDIMLPGMDGYEVLKRVREKRTLPVLMLSSLDTTTDIVLGLELGADDYMTKPFSVRELQARVKALLRRSDPAPRDRPFTHGALVLDINARSCLWGGNELDLTQKEFDLLHYLMLNRGLALTRARILDAVWGYDSAGGDRTVDTHVKTLRAKLREAGAGDPIETLRGVGYRFTAEEPD